MQFQHTAARRRLLKYNPAIIKMFDVSTHSRPKAAALIYIKLNQSTKFQHTAARRRLRRGLRRLRPHRPVSTHSRPKAAAARTTPSTPSPPGFNTQPPEGGCKVGITALPGLFCFNTQPPEGGCLMEALIFLDNEVSTHSRPKAATELSIIVTI